MATRSSLDARPGLPVLFLASCLSCGVAPATYVGLLTTASRLYIRGYLTPPILNFLVGYASTVAKLVTGIRLLPGPPVVAEAVCFKLVTRRTFLRFRGLSGG